MNVYDFDHTLYKGDSTIDFWKYEISKHPKILLDLPHQFLYAFKYLLGHVSKEKFKEEFYVFFQRIDDIDTEVNNFWDKQEGNFYPWYTAFETINDVVISASPEFIVREGCKRIGIKKVVASKVDKNSGHYAGKNCRGEEKVRRYREVFDQVPIDKFYSDSRSDDPLADISREAFLVKNGKIVPWKK